MLVKENIFKLLTNPLFFNTNEKGFGWQERRKILFDICGGVSDEDVINSVVTSGDKSMLDLLSVINSGRTIEHHKLVVAEQIKNTKKAKEDIPAKISEKQRDIPVDAVDYTAIENALASHRTTLEGIELELATNAQGASLYRQKQQQAYRLQGELDTRKRELDVMGGALLKKLIDERAILENEKYSVSKDISWLDASSIVGSEELKAIEGKVIELRQIWAVENSKQFVAPEGIFCPTCEQPLPEGQAQEKIGKLKENFDKNKAQLLESIRKQGRDKADRAEVLNKERESNASKLETLEGSLKRINERLSELETQIEAEQKPSEEPNYYLDEQYGVLFDRINELKAELDRPIEDTTTELLTKKREVTEQIESLNKVLNQKEVVSMAKVRIEELKAEESKLAAELNEYERQDFLIKQFTTAKVKMLEDAINSRFKTVKFKMFDTLQDGTEKEICKTLVNTNGVYVEFDGANNGGKIVAGLSIIEMLSEYYGVSCPIFIDNFESITGVVDAKAQVIKLIVSEVDEKLRVELN